MKPEFLEKISISGYKSIKDTTVELNRINVLIASNGDGKSRDFFHPIECGYRTILWGNCGRKMIKS